ncbi:cell division protein FtsQ/DivIB [Streptomyces boninensis]|uniref:cell division protein FtsQ/DivIB n=1 Tax=Streptomyces boninensis TaxID=2039455 RepID=UPI003B213305
MAGATTAKRDERRGSASPPSGRRPRGGGSGARPAWRRLANKRLAVVALVLAALLGGFAGWALYGSNWLRVERVQASGTRVLTADEVVGAAAVGTGGPLASVDTDGVAARLRKELPRIKSVDVQRSWPHTVKLVVTERTPAVLLHGGDGRYTEVDAEGVRYATVVRPPRKVPVLEVAADNSPSLKRFDAERLRAEAIKVAGQLPVTLRHATRTIKVTSYDSITLQLADDRTVLWGSAERGKAKARVLTALMKAAKGADHFDVSAPSAPAAS